MLIKTLTECFDWGKNLVAELVPRARYSKKRV